MARSISADLPDITNPIWTRGGSHRRQGADAPVGILIISPTALAQRLSVGSASSRFNEVPVESTIKAIVDAVQQAKAKLQPAVVGFGTGKAYLNVNLDAINKQTRLWTQAGNLDGPSDKTLAVVIFKDLTGRSHSRVHELRDAPVNAFLTGITSADHPGAACRYVEKAFKDDMVMLFTQGAAGDQNPLYLRPGTNVQASKSGVAITGYEMVRQPIESGLGDGIACQGGP